jgi:hypothetical protein
MSSPQNSRSIASFTTRLDQTLKILEERVKQQEQLLEEVILDALNRYMLELTQT